MPKGSPRSIGAASREKHAARQDSDLGTFAGRGAHHRGLGAGYAVRDQGERPQWLTEHKISVPILIAEKRSTEFPDTPTIMELVKDEATRAQLDLLMVAQNLDRPVMLPPGVPAARVAELRQALGATMADEAVRQDVEKKNLHVDPVRGEDMAGALARAFALPADVVAGAREMMGSR
jgi:hypothetical protein